MKMKKYLLDSGRKRKIDGGFAFIPHKFLFDGYFSLLSNRELSLYFLLILASDRDGLSYFSYTKTCNILKIDLDEYIEIRNSLIKKSLIAFNGSLYQVLSLLENPHIVIETAIESEEEMSIRDPATVRRICEKSLRGN